MSLLNKVEIIRVQQFFQYIPLSREQKKIKIKKVNKLSKVPQSTNAKLKCIVSNKQISARLLSLLPRTVSPYQKRFVLSSTYFDDDDNDHSNSGSDSNDYGDGHSDYDEDDRLEREAPHWQGKRTLTNSW